MVECSGGARSCSPSMGSRIQQGGKVEPTDDGRNGRRGGGNGGGWGGGDVSGKTLGYAFISEGGPKPNVGDMTGADMAGDGVGRDRAIRENSRLMGEDGASMGTAAQSSGPHGDFVAGASSRDRGGASMMKQDIENQESSNGVDRSKRDGPSVDDDYKGNDKQRHRNREAKDKSPLGTTAARQETPDTCVGTEEDSEADEGDRRSSEIKREKGAVVHEQHHHHLKGGQGVDEKPLVTTRIAHRADAGAPESDKPSRTPSGQSSNVPGAGSSTGGGAYEDGPKGADNVRGHDRRAGNRGRGVGEGRDSPRDGASQSPDVGASSSRQRAPDNSAEAADKGGPGGSSLKVSAPRRSTSGWEQLASSSGVGRTGRGFPRPSDPQDKNSRMEEGAAEEPASWSSSGGPDYPSRVKRKRVMNAGAMFASSAPSLSSGSSKKSDGGSGSGAASSSTGSSKNAAGGGEGNSGAVARSVQGNSPANEGGAEESLGHRRQGNDGCDVAPGSRGSKVGCEISSSKVGSVKPGAKRFRASASSAVNFRETEAGDEGPGGRGGNTGASKDG